MKCTIIGGGIGGLSLANALINSRFEIKVYESAEQLKPVGAGITLAPNAINTLGKLGLGEDILKNGNLIKKAAFCTPELIPFSRFSDPQSINIHRADLHETLLKGLDPNILVLNKKCLKIENEEGNPVRIFFQDGDSAETDILIGADGINSAVREHIFPESKIRYSGQTCWRGTCHYELPGDMKDAAFEIWGGRFRFGFLEYKRDEVYWYATARSQRNGEDYLEKLRSKLLKLASGFNPIIHELIQATDLDNIYRGDLCDIHPPLENWHKGNICLIGDAAHATTPNMGQGACQAIEDAYTLAACLKKYDDTEAAFKRFQVLREGKVNFVVKNSWMVGQMAHWENPLLTWLRNKTLQSTPEKIAAWQLEKVYDTEYQDDI